MADVTVAEQREHLLVWLRSTGVEAPLVRETHVSFVAFAGDRVWKCKKAVQFPFIDLTSLEQRRKNCEREVALNRRLAPGVYLGVVPVSIEGTVVDYAVEMQRMADASRLSTIIDRDPDAGAACVDAIADRLVRFHRSAPTGGAVDASATPSAIARLWSSCCTEMRELRPMIFATAAVDRTELDALTYLAGRATLFAERIGAGRIRDGHGDLLADDAFCTDEGPQLLDCLEFDDALRYGDVLGDVAFLAMDLEWQGRPDLAARLLERYRIRSGDQWPPSLEHFYIAYRALVRTKVAGLRVPDDPDSRASATGLLALATAHLERGRMRLVLIGGAPATGKTTTANEVARRSGFAVLHSDDTRKELAGVAPHTSAANALDRGIYSQSWSDRTYDALLTGARLRLRMGESVIVDASWSSRRYRAQAEALAAETECELTAFVCEAPQRIADERARRRARARARDDASDASAAIAREIRARFDPWPAAVVVETADGSEPAADRVLCALGLLTNPK